MVKLLTKAVFSDWRTCKHQIGTTLIYWIFRNCFAGHLQGRNPQQWTPWNIYFRYFVPHCRLNSIDCRHNWQLRRRIMGTCLELDPAVVLQAEVNGKPEFDVPKHLRFVLYLQGTIIYKFSLGVSIGYNFTDSTYGWNGFMDGFTGMDSKSKSHTMEEAILICIIYECL